MFMISKDRRVTLDELRNIKVPSAQDVGRTSRWKPVQHYDLVSTIHKALRQRGFKLRAQAWGLGGTSGSKNDKKLFGSIDFDVVPGVNNLPAGLKPTLGVRHSNDGQYAVSFAVGAKVIVCSNGIFVGEFIVKRKHTKGIDLEGAIHEGLDQYVQMLPGVEHMYFNLSSITLDYSGCDPEPNHSSYPRPQVERALVDMMRRKIIHSRDVVYIDTILSGSLDEAEQTVFPKFDRCTALAFLNACMRRAQAWSPRDQSRRIPKIHAYVNYSDIFWDERD